MGKVLAEHQGQEPSILGAGEFQIINGKVGRVNNRSGLYSVNNKGANLNYSVDALRSHGLQIEANTETIDLSTAKDLSSVHTTASENSVTRLKLAHDPYYKEWSELFRKLYAKYPSSKKAGHFDADKLFEIFESLPNEKQKTMFELISVSNFVGNEGLAHALMLANAKGSTARITELLREIAN